jgi:heme exporter protein CcmD
MIHGGWAFIWSAYALTLAALTALALVVVMRLRHWARRARELERR